MPAKQSSLDELFDAWDKETGGGRDAARARQITHEHIKANPADYNDLDELARNGESLPEFGEEGIDTAQAAVVAHLVRRIDALREVIANFEKAGMTDEVARANDEKLRIDVWLMSRVDPQQIGGQANVVLRLPNEGV